MDEAKLSTAGKNLLKGKFGEEKIDSVTCPAEKPAKKDTHFDCTFAGDAGTRGKLLVEVTDNDGGYTIAVSEIQFTAKAVEDRITATFKEKNPQLADQLASVECPATIASKPGTTSVCTLTDTSGSTADLTVTIGEDLLPAWDFGELANQ